MILLEGQPPHVGPQGGGCGRYSNQVVEDSDNSADGRTWETLLPRLAAAWWWDQQLKLVRAEEREEGSSAPPCELLWGSEVRGPRC
jgi:hypothetical protein